MIISSRDGRHRSRRTKSEKWKDILGRSKNLNIGEQVLFNRLMEDVEEVSRAGEIGFDSRDEINEIGSVFHNVTSEHYDGELASLEEWLLDDYYLGAIGKDIYPKWKDDLHELFEGNYTEGIISGSIGSGKTTFCEVALLRVFYEVTMLVDPQSSFGLMQGSEILFVCFNRDDTLARDVTYGGIRSKLELSPYFNEIGCRIKASGTFLPGKNIRIIPVSVRSAKALGRNVISGIIDEADFLEGSSISGKERAIAPGERPFAELLHESITRRIKSRYDRGGFVPGKLLLSSSARNKNSFTNQRIKEVAKDPYVFCRDYAIYDVKPAENFSKDRFWVLVGNERIRHRILTDEEYAAFLEDDLQRMEEEGCSFLHVPENFRSDFERNIEDSIRDIGGVVTAAISPFIQLKEKILESVDPTLKHPVQSEIWVTGRPARMIWSRVCHQVEEKISYSQRELVLRPIRHPDSPRHVHIDLSLGKTDATGMCIAHIVDMVDVERRAFDGHVYAEQAPLIEVDLLLRIEAPPNGEIDVGSVRGLVYHFMERGFHFNFASMDAFQSAESLQKFRQQGIQADKVSVDAKMEPYDYLKLAIYEGRLSMYNYPVVLKELRELERNTVKGKVDHPQNGSKDVSDALAGVVYTLSTKSSTRSPIMMGISEYEDADQDTEWIRATMHKKGDKAPKPVGDTPVGGSPLIFTG